MTIERKLGSSEIGAVWALYDPSVAYLAKQKTAGDVWLRLAHAVEWKGNARTNRGLEMEPELAALYAETVGPWSRPVPWGAQWVVPHPDHDFATCSPDAYGDDVIVELKTQSIWARPQWGTPGTSEVPDSYNCQCQWLLACTGRPTAHVLVAFGSDVTPESPEDPSFPVVETAMYFVHANAALQSKLLAFGERFTMDFVRTGRPPLVKPNDNRTAWKKRLKENGYDPKSPEYVDLKPKRAKVAGAEAVGGDGGGGPHPEDGA